MYKILWDFAFLSITVSDLNSYLSGIDKICHLIRIVLERNSVIELTLNPPEGIIAGPISEDNFFEWECLITGPDETCFENGVFPAKIIFPQVLSAVILFYMHLIVF